ncbi:MAG: regulatory protein RecX, partial [Clostridia bacterium]|nr:regulatory protein RecX [Clostridia bacterium]
VDEVYFYALNLKENADVTAEELKEITIKAGERRAYNYAVSLLSRREHTIKEITEKLKRKGYGQFCEKVTDRLVSEGYLSDERFAKLYVRELINLKGYGIRRIRDELYRKGISREIAEDAMNEAEMPENRLKELVEKKYMRYLNDEKGVQKTINALLRSGYSYGEIKDALREIADENDIFEVDDE